MFNNINKMQPNAISVAKINPPFFIFLEFDFYINVAPRPRISEII